MNHLQKSVIAFIRQNCNLGVRNLFRTVFSGNTETENVIEYPTPNGSPVLHRKEIQFCPKYFTKRQVWVESLKEIKEKKIGLVELHPKVFGTMPRLDLIFDNVKWQNLYQNTVAFSAKVKTEFRGHTRKPWPQKGTGRARQGSIRSPQFIGGGSCHGPRNPTSYFYMIPWELRLHGLTSTLSAKFAQDDIHVVDDLQIPTDDKQFILDLIKERNWGPSVLMVDVNDIMPRKITIATDKIDHVNLMPVYGMNVRGMLKHDTLILTLAAVEEIEKKIVTLLNTANPIELTNKFS